MSTVGIWDHGRGPNGHRLADPRDPVVRAALGRVCPECDAQPDEWCVGIAKDSKTCGRRRSRLHFARCQFDREGVL